MPVTHISAVTQQSAAEKTIAIALFNVRYGFFYYFIILFIYYVIIYDIVLVIVPLDLQISRISASGSLQSKYTEKIEKHAAANCDET